jgi:hypothetical protein
MAIEVTCPGCKKQFKVSDQFAGKKGPCPSCKTVITIPLEKKAEVVIHAPETSGPTDATGRPVLKPLARKETKLSPLMIGIIVGACLAALFGALGLRVAYGDESIPRFLLALGAILLAPPLALAGYAFLRDQELEPHRGRSMMLRVAACSAAYVVLWGLYTWIPAQLELDLEPMYLTFILPAMIAIGAFAAFASFDLDFTSAAMHYGLYLLVTIVLCMVAGHPLWTTPTG